MVQLEREPEEGVVVSSDRATTCVVLVAHCASSQRALVAHLDSIDRHVCDDLRGCFSQLRNPNVFLVGAYTDSNGTGRQLLGELAGFLHDGVALEIHLQLFCCGALNTDAQNQPIAQGLAYCTSTCTPYVPSPGAMYPGKCSNSPASFSPTPHLVPTGCR